MRTLLVTSPPMHGDDVLRAQRDLKALGYEPGAVNGIYGPHTHDEVVHFQKAHHLRVDGVLGSATWAALTAAEKKPPHKAPAHQPPARPAHPSPGLLAVEYAAKFIGIKEEPPGSNRQQFGVWIGVNGAAWCNIFVSYNTLIAAGITLCRGFHGPGVVARGCTYVPTTEQWFKSTGHWHGRDAKIEDGLVAIYNWDGGVPDHIGFAVTEATLHKIAPTAFAKALAMFGPLHSGELWSIEGNTGIGNDSNGGEVMIRQRDRSQIDGFGVLAK